MLFATRNMTTSPFLLYLDFFIRYSKHYIDYMHCMDVIQASNNELHGMVSSTDKQVKVWIERW